MSSWYSFKKDKEPKAPSFAHEYPGSKIVINVGQDDEEYQKYMKQFEKEVKEKEAKEKEEKEAKEKKAEQKAWDDWFKDQFAKYKANQEPADDNGDVPYSEYMKQWRRHMKETYGTDKPKEIKEVIEEKTDKAEKDESYKDYMLEWRKKMKEEYGYSANYPESSKPASNNSSNESLQEKLRYLNLEPEEGGPAYIYAESKVKYGSSSKDKKMKSFEYIYKRGD